MQTSASDAERSSSSSSSRRFGIQIPGFIRSPLTLLLEQAGVYEARSVAQGPHGFVINRNSRHRAPRAAVQMEVEEEEEEEGDVVVEEEVSIRIIGSAEHEVERNGIDGANNGAQLNGGGIGNAASSSGNESREDDGEDDFDSGSGGVSNGGDSSYQRYDIQHLASCTFMINSCSGLLEFSGFSVTVWITGVMYKSNDILRKQTALKGERKVPVLVGISLVFVIHVVFIYWWYRNEDLLYPLILFPPKTIPPFWHAIFIIMVNGSTANSCRVSIVVVPCPAANTSLVRYFFMALRALSRKEVHYGSYATTEQVNAAGDLCAICQEKMHAPILLRCKHIFCEDCVSEWYMPFLFERERTCPLCRALVKPASIKSYGDGSTSIFFQLF
ncbi:hypothetical protein FEM48_Zijuj02G0119100 [Ziziphus jujuba var. spinosa]|uniref:RING-type domain-containing protein n=1 Tax=Ziziphus jujuba var. spinosa TaxID=714518 RepID=A0A978VVK8_ZIZJJ|nr:hypothetical protein FEM48_Zijuj02G0119100 [Ziziphus jujuba var. spinosa]